MKKALLLIAFLSPAPLSAQQLSLEQCLQLARDNNLSLKAARTTTEQAQILQSTAWDVDKTSLTLSQDPTSGGSPDNSLVLSQTIDFPTRYIARRHLLQAETLSRRAEASVVANRISGQVAALYYTLVYQRERLAILQSQDTILSHYEDMATRRFQAGEARQLEPLNAGRLLHENRLDMKTAWVEYDNTQTELARLLGISGRVEPAEGKLAPISFQADGSYADAGTPEGRLAEERLHAADEAVRVERSAYAPTLTLALCTQMVIKGWNPYHTDRGWHDGNFMGFELGVGIPIFTRATRARVKAARKEREVLQLRTLDEAAGRRNEYTAAMGRMLAAKARIDYFTSTGCANAAKMADISAKAYEAGEIGYIEYVAALQQSVDTQLKYAAAVNDFNQAVITLNTLYGIHP